MADSSIHYTDVKIHEASPTIESRAANGTDAADLTVDCGTDKTLVLSETVYKDINLASAILSLPVATQPDEVQFKDEAGNDTGITTWGFAINELVCGSFELQHDYKEGTDLVFHVHWQGIAAPADGTDNVKWQIIYTVARDSTTLDATATISGQTAITTQYSFYRTDLTTITGTNFKIGDQMLFQFKRIAASADDYAGDALVATLGVHYQVDTIGSRAIGAK